MKLSKNDYILALKSKNLFLPPKIRSSNLEGKQYSHEGILYTPWIELCWYKLLERYYLCP